MSQKMTADEALVLAEGWAAGMTFDAKSDGPFTCLLALAEEVRRLRMELAHEEQRVADMMDAVNRVGHEIEQLRADARRLDWIEAAADARKIEIASSLYGTGYEIGEWPSMRVSVTSGSLRAAIDAAMEASNAG